ncbi:MAG: type II toxin-antitoxin system VapC family toxin [Acidimicrobiia bacterium]
MNLVDANVLLYAVNEDAHHHRGARAWLDEALSGAETVGFSWLVLLSFVRVSTKVGLLPNPLPIDGAMSRVEAWLAAGPALVVEPSVDHVRILSGLLADLGAGGNLVNDAHLAALAVEHRGRVVSYDSDFGRFRDIEWIVPGTR